MNFKGNTSLQLSPIRPSKQQNKLIAQSPPQQQKYYSAKKINRFPKSRVVQVNTEPDLEQNQLYYSRKKLNFGQDSKQSFYPQSSVYSQSPKNSRPYLSHREIKPQSSRTQQQWNNQKSMRQRQLESEQQIQQHLQKQYERIQQKQQDKSHNSNMSFNNTMVSIYSNCRKEKNPLKQIAKDFQSQKKQQQLVQKRHKSTTSLQKHNSTFASSFSDRIQGAYANIKHHMGLLKQDKFFREHQSFYNFDHNVNSLDPELHDIKDEFYNESIKNMHEGQRVQSELYLNTRFKNVHNQAQKMQQTNQYFYLTDKIKKNQKKQQQIQSHINIPIKYQYNQDSSVNDGNSVDNKLVSDKKDKKVSFLGNNNQQQQQKGQQQQQQNGKQVQFNPLIHDKKEMLTHIRQYIEVNDWHPQGRVGATLTEANGYIYLIGGRANDLVSDVCILKTQKHHQQENKWISLQLYQKYKYEQDQPIFQNMRQHKTQSLLKKTSRLAKLTSKFNIGGGRRESGTSSYQQQNNSVEHNSSKENNNANNKETFKESAFTSQNDIQEEFTGRFNHTACLWNNSIVIFGGEQHFDQRYKKRSVLNDVFMFNVESLQWKKKLCRGDTIEARRNHTATILGNLMVVFGGVNSFEKSPIDLVYLDLTDNKWRIQGDQGKYENIFEKTGSLCYHTACAVYEDVGKQKLHSSKFYKPHALIKEQGLYFYGGKFGNNKVNGDVYLLNTFTFPLQWKKLETTGNPPAKRYSHSMEYDSIQKNIIIAGGKTETNDIQYLNDIFVLKLHNFEWLKVDFLPEQAFEPKASFASCMEDSQLFIFGGLREDQFYGGELNILEFDQKRISKIKRGFDYSKKDAVYEEQQSKNQRMSKMQYNRTSGAAKSFMPLPQLNYMQLSKNSNRRNSQGVMIDIEDQELETFRSPPPEEAQN